MVFSVYKIFGFSFSIDVTVSSTFSCLLLPYGQYQFIVLCSLFTILAFNVFHIFVPWNPVAVNREEM